MKKRSLRTQLTLAFGTMALVCVILIGLFANWQLEIHFKEYILQSQFMQSHQGTSNSDLYYNELDLHFIQTLNHVLYTVGGAVFVAAVLLGAVLSQRITQPIIRVIRATELLGKNQWQEPLTTDHPVKELDELSTAVNHLALRLDEQSVLRKRLTADVAHELRTPLATLQSHLEAMIDGVWEPSVPRLNSCHEEIVRISRLVGDLEKLERYEQDLLTLSKSHLSLKQLAEQIADQFESSLQKAGLEIQITGEPGTVQGDSDKLKQVLFNLVGNAVKFTSRGGKILIHIADEAKGVILKVEDTGCGISSKDLPFIFERFYRADLSRARATGGTGIGLSLVKAITEAHGGWVSAASELGKGTVISVFLPKE